MLLRLHVGHSRNNLHLLSPNFYLPRSFPLSNLATCQRTSQTPWKFFRVITDHSFGVEMETSSVNLCLLLSLLGKKNHLLLTAHSARGTLVFIWKWGLIEAEGALFLPSRRTIGALSTQQIQTVSLSNPEINFWGQTSSFWQHVVLEALEFPYQNRG